mmetsp:Transcript_21802/g.39109  ORF Transcript_21802/g.39109 Transcript_21802/m.39109 type:complete len:245 (-) Transcript_21802:146-880(-)
MKSARVECVVFDLDDTLWNTVETLDCAHEAMREAFAARCPNSTAPLDNISFRKEMLQTAEANPQRSHDFTFLRQETLSRLCDDPALAAEIYDIWFTVRNNPEFFPGALEALKELRKRGITVGTLTDGNSDPHSMIGLKDVIDFSVNSVEAGAPKPDRRMFSLCETKSGCAPSAMVMVGDNADKDVAGAKNAGWRAIWVHPPKNGIVGSVLDLGGGGQSSAAEADADVDSVAQLPEILTQWLQGQ